VRPKTFLRIWLLWTGIYLLLALAGPNGPRPFWPVISQHLLQVRAWVGSDIVETDPAGRETRISVSPRLDLSPYFSHRVVHDPRENSIISNIAVRIPGPGGCLVPAQENWDVGRDDLENIRCDLGFPPGPAFLLLPLYLLLGSFLATSWLGAVLGGLAVAAMNLLFEGWAERMGFDAQSLPDAAMPLLAGGGTLLLWAAPDGGTFLFAQTVGLSFLSLALAMAVSGRPWIASSAYALAITSRPAMLGALPLFLFLGYQASENKGLSRLIALLSPSVLLGSITLLLNQLRFSSPFLFGYHAMLVPPFLRERLAEHGQLALSYLPRNIKWVLLHPPILVSGFAGKLNLPVSDPRGMGFLFVTPAFLALLFAFRPPRPGSRMLPALTWVSLILCILPGLMYYNTGWVQWGGRFLLDAWPIFLLLAGLGLSRLSRRVMWMLILLSVLSNVWSQVLILTGVWPGCCS